MNFPYKAILFDWAYSLVDLVCEDDRAAFLKVKEFLENKMVVLPEFEVLFSDYQEIFYGLIKESRITHREANFETVLRYIFFKHGVEIDNLTTYEEILTVYYEVIHGVRKIYPDVVGTLDQLYQAGVRMGIVSNTTNPSFIKEEELRLTELDKYFEFAVYSSNVPYRKPHPSIYEGVVTRLQINVDEVLFVGDDLIMDVQGPQSIGMSAAWLNRNGALLLDGISPDYQITNLLELLQIKPLNLIN
jgi:putative hydrolase of the HAD superfamily